MEYRFPTEVLERAIYDDGRFYPNRMRYRIAAIGKMKRGFYADGCGVYLDRLNKLGRAELVEVPDGRGKDPRIRQEHETAALLAQADGYIIAVDESGHEHSSQSMAQAIDELELRGVSRVTLLIGGPDGHTRYLKAKTDTAWSLSLLTLPHELARLVLLEQLYRAETIRAGHPYHRT